jgi:hypothetical protein
MAGQKISGNADFVIARSEATRQSNGMDCFAALAMTVWRR